MDGRSEPFTNAMKVRMPLVKINSSALTHGRPLQKKVVVSVKLMCKLVVLRDMSVALIVSFKRRKWRVHTALNITFHLKTQTPFAAHVLFKWFTLEPFSNEAN